MQTLPPIDHKITSIQKYQSTSLSRAIAKLGEEVTITERGFLLQLAYYANPDGTSIYPGIMRLATDMGVCERTIRKHFESLLKKGFVMRDGMHGHRKQYRLNLPGITPRCEASAATGTDNTAAAPPAPAAPPGGRGESPGLGDLNDLFEEESDRDLLRPGEQTLRTKGWVPPELHYPSPPPAPPKKESPQEPLTEKERHRNLIVKGIHAGLGRSMVEKMARDRGLEDEIEQMYREANKLT